MRIREHVADTTEASEKERERKRSHQTNFNPLTEIVRLCRAVPRSHPVGADSRPAPHAAERLIDIRAAARSPHEQGEAGARGEHGCWGGEGSTREGKETASFFHSLTRSLARANKRKMGKKMPSGHFGFLPYFFSFDPVDDPDDPPPKKKQNGSPRRSCRLARPFSCRGDRPRGPHLAGRCRCRLRLLPRDRGRRRSAFEGPSLSFLPRPFLRDRCCVLRGGRGRLPGLCRRGERGRKRGGKKEKEEVCLFFISAAWELLFFFHLPLPS